VEPDTSGDRVNSGGANGTHGFVRLNLDGSVLGGTLAIPNKPADGLSDFSIEFYLRTPDTTNGQFRLQIEDSETISTSSTQAESLLWGANGWEFLPNPMGGCLAAYCGNETLSPNAWYRFRFVGRDWGTSNAHYDLQLSDRMPIRLRPAIQLAFLKVQTQPSNWRATLP